MSLADLTTLFLVPPLNCLVAACVGAALPGRRVGRILLRTGLAGLVLLSLPLVSGTLVSTLQGTPPPAPGAPPAAIVILSADEMEIAVPGGGAYTVGRLTLERERAGAALARQTGLPVLLSGGQIRAGAPTLAALMAASLRGDFNVAPRWLETQSTDTWQNAARSATMLRADGITSVYLVTHAWHMRRALIAFRAAGLRAVPGPALVEIAPHLAWRFFIPRVSSWQESYWALHEWIGCGWYWMRAQA